MIVHLNKRTLNSFLVAMYICEVLIANVLAIFVKLSHYPLYVLAFLTIATLFVNKKFDFGKIAKSAFLYFIILIFFGISGILNGFANINQYFQYFITFGTVALLVSSLDTDPTKVMIYVIYIFFWFILHYFIFIRQGFLAESSEAYQARSMGLAYSLTTLIYISIAYFFFKKEFEFSNRQNFACIICSLASIYILVFDCGTRGPVFSCIIGFFLAYIAYTKNKNKNKVLILLVIAIISFYIYSNVGGIVNFLIYILGKYAIIPEFLKKIQWFLNRNNFFNGRDILYYRALKYIKSSPLIGHGIGYFEAKGAGGYVHSIFLELLYTFGIIGTYFFMSYIFKNLKSFILSSKKTKETIFSFVLMSSFTALIFSNSLWLSPLFWYMFFFFYKNTHILKFRKKRDHEG